MLNVVSIVDVSSPSALLICSDIIKDVAADATMNKAANHDSVTTDIITVMEEIVHENENKALETDVIADMAEDTINEAVGQSSVETTTDMQWANKL